MRVEGEIGVGEGKGGGRVGGLMKLEGEVADGEGKGGGRVRVLMKLEGEVAHGEGKGGGRVRILMKLEGGATHVEDRDGGRVGRLIKTDAPPVYPKEVPEGHHTVEKGPEAHVLPRHGEIPSEGEYKDKRENTDLSHLDGIANNSQSDASSPEMPRALAAETPEAVAVKAPQVDSTSDAKHNADGGEQGDASKSLENMNKTEKD